MAGLIGLDVGAAGVVAAEVAGRGTRRSVRRIAEVPLPPGTVECGDLRDPDAVVRALRRLWKSSRLGHRRVRVGVLHRQVQVRETTVPALRRSELLRSLPLHVAGEFPGGTDGLVLDLVPTEHVVASEGAFWRGLLVSVPETGVDALLQVVRRAGLDPVAADLSALALARCFDGVAAREVVALVDVGRSATQVAVLREGRLQLVRLVPVGIGAATQDEVVTLVDGIGTTLDYQRRSTPDTPVARVVLTGGGAVLDGFGQYVASVLGLHVAVGDPLAAVSASPHLRDEARTLAPRAAVAIGLASGGTA